MEKWNYLIPEGSRKDLQDDWNQTLITKLHFVSKGTKKKKNLILINVPNKFKPLIESLLYYHNNKIADRYIVKFVDSNNNLIDVGGVNLEVENYDEKLH